MSGEFNTALLLLARQYRRKSQSAVADAAGMNQGHYSRIENDLTPDGPSQDSAERIATALQFPVAFFYQQDGLAGLPLSVHPMHRRKRSVGERVLRQIHAELNLRLIHLRRYLRAVDLEPQLPLPMIDVDEGGGPLEIARTIRKAWQIADGPIDNLTDFCEAAGILVIWCEFGTAIDGVTMMVRDLPPCIFLNSQVPADRMRASLAHELGHIIMHRVPTDNIENEANAFAGELLVPERQFRRSAIGERITLEWLARQKAYWKASMNFLLYRLGVLEIINRHQSEYLWKKLSVLGWRTREPQETDFKSEEPLIFPKLIKLHSEDLKYDLAGFQALLNTDAVDIKRLYGTLIGRGRWGLYVVA